MTKVLEHRFVARGAGLEVFRDRSPEVLLAGPAGTGKSRAALEKLHQLALRNPGMRGLMLRKTATSLTSSALVTWKRDVVANALLDGSIRYYGGSAQEPAQFIYANGSTIALGGMDKATRIMSTEYDCIYVQEATELTENEWEMAGTRLRNGVISFQQLLADCNPDHPTHWLKERADRGATHMLHSRHEDNPRYFNEDGTQTEEGAAYMARLDALTGVRRLRLRLGIWAASEGVIYEGFDPAWHVLEALPAAAYRWERYWAIDFGYTNPFVWQEWAVDEDGRLYLIQEIYRTKLLVEDAAEQIRQLTANSPRPRAIITDHDAEDRATLERKLSCSTTAANKNVSEGIQATQSRFKMAGDGRPRIFFHKYANASKDQLLVDARKPTSTLGELPGYVWNDKGKDEPLKENDHGCDAMRYLVAHRDINRGSGVRWLG